MDILDVTPVFEYWFKKKNGNGYKQPAQIIASIVATGNEKSKNSETKLDISRRNEAIKIYKKMKKMTEYEGLCESVDNIITASKNLQKATLRKYKYVKEMLDLVDEIKACVSNIVNEHDIKELNINSVDLSKQKIDGKELTINEDKNKFVIEVLAQLGYKNQMKFIGLNRTVKAKEKKENKLKIKFYSYWPDELKDIWKELLNTKGSKLLYSNSRDSGLNSAEGVFVRFLRKLCDTSEDTTGLSASILTEIKDDFYTVNRLDRGYLEKIISKENFLKKDDGIGYKIKTLMYRSAFNKCRTLSLEEYTSDQSLERCLVKIRANLSKAIEDL